MIKFENVTPLEDFKKYIEWEGIVIREDELLSVNPHLIKGKRVWNITDKFNNEWNVMFSGNVDEWSIFNVSKIEPLFRVDIISSGNKIEIHRAEKNGRKLKADKNLKQFCNLAMWVNCLIHFGYLK